jgi:PhnB protein
MADPVQVITPHLVVNDGNAAIEFYKKALGATEALRMPAQDGKRLCIRKFTLAARGFL